MTFADLKSGESVFLDANILVYHFIPFPVLGPLCSELIERIGNMELMALTSTHILSEVAHRLMTTEASHRFGWQSKIVDRLKRQPGELQKLSAFRVAVEMIPELGIQVVTIRVDQVAEAATLSIQHGLLSHDALTVTVMQAHGLTNIASNDADFDRVPWIKRYAPA